MDAIVTTPKKEIDNARKEGDEIEKHGGHWFRVFRFRPKVECGDRLYFVENGEITGYGLVIEVSQIDLPEQCDVTGRDWGKPGDWMVCYRNWHWLKPRLKMKGFQGIRYVERLPKEVKEALCGDTMRVTAAVAKDTDSRTM